MSSPDRGTAKLPAKVHAAVEAIRAKYQPDRIVLFGSYAWGNPREDSDVDLFVVKQTTDPPLRRSYQVLRLIQKEKRGLPMDVVVVTPRELEERIAAHDPFVADIMRRGVVLYAA